MAPGPGLCHVSYSDAMLPNALTLGGTPKAGAAAEALDGFHGGFPDDGVAAAGGGESVEELPAGAIPRGRSGRYGF